MAENKFNMMLEDGRRAEKVVKEMDFGDGVREKVVEVWAEPNVNKNLEQRVTEYTKPVVHRRVIESIDPGTGEISSKVVEDSDDVQLRVVDRVASADSVSAMNAAKANSGDPMTRQDLVEAMGMLADRLTPSVAAQSAPEPQKYEPMVSQQSVIEERLAEKEKTPMGDMIIWGVIAAEAATLGYLAWTSYQMMAAMMM